MKKTDSHRPPAAPTPAAAPASPAADPAPLPEPEFGFAPPEHYDLAEYRWVPVRRRPRLDGWTEEKQRRFIEVLADTGLVSLAAREVGMTRQAAYALRRAPHAAAFARAWDVARERAGTLIEDIAFERAIEGVEQEVYDGFGELKGSRTIYNDRLLTFLLGHLRPERYSREARRARAAWAYGGGPDDALAQDRPEPQALPMPAARAVTLDDALRAMEPAMPAAPEDLLDAEQLENDLLCAEIADGKLPHFLTEQRARKSPERLEAEARAAQHERGRLANEKMDRKESLSDAEFEDMCIYLDPTQANEKRRKRKPAKPAREA